jgi:alpha-ketoglutarate-dependent taurine dioxygenase
LIEPLTSNDPPTPRVREDGDDELFPDEEVMSVTSVPASRKPIDDPKAWFAGTVGDPPSWHHPLSDSLVAALRSVYQGRSREDRPVTDLRLSEHERTALGEHLAPARRDLEQGRGFVILDRLPVEGLSRGEATALYWLLGQLLGEPAAQNVEGTLLYDVRDTGQDVAHGARFSVTSYESSFHTDNSFGDGVVDYVGLLCLQTARSGGISQNVSGYTALETLRAEDPAALDTLERPFHVDRRGGFRPGESPTVLHPVLTRDGSGPTFRYLRHWIESGHEKDGEPLSEAQRHALDALDAVLQRPDLRVEFSLRPGQIYFINNRWIFHNRTAFVDDPEPERRRHLVRLWLNARDARPAPPR